MEHCVSAVLDIECLSVEGTSCETDPLTCRFVDLVARWNVLVAIGVELFGIFPVAWVDARFPMWSDDVAVPFVRRRCQFFDSRFTATVRRNSSEQLHHESLKRCELRTVCSVEVSFHCPVEPTAEFMITGVIA